MKYILIIISIILVSMFLFPIEFRSLRGINTKQMLVVAGIISFGWHAISIRSISISRELFISSIIAVLFSIVCYYSVVYNNSSDYAYSAYIGSMWIWFLACYGVCTFVALTHGYISVKLLVHYLLFVCVAQCFIALLIDFNSTFKDFIDSIFVTGDLTFMEETGRLYGIGALLDVSGVRFSAVLVMSAVLLTDDKKIRSSTLTMILYILGFCFVAIVGNMMARTTSIGVVLGLGYILFFSGIFSVAIKNNSFKFWLILLACLIGIIGIAVYLYRTNEDINNLLRFAFEGFFNWVETGEWETDSTEVLKNMWILPENDKTWIMGDGYFNDPFTGKFYMLTDVGYLRFIYYSGLIGLSIFCIFFFYMSFALGNLLPYVRNIFLLLLVVALVNWLKVSTDIFLVYAFFLVITQPYFKDNFYKIDFESI